MTFTLAGACIGALIQVVLITAHTLIQEHLSGTSKNYLIDIILSAFLGYAFVGAFYSSFALGYLIFFTLLGVTLFTDAWVMLISRHVTLRAVWIAWMLTMMKLLPLSFGDSLFGAFFGYMLLLIVAKIAKKYFQQEALGQGDKDLLCMIGAFTGWQGCWFALLIGSILGSCFGLILKIKNNNSLYHQQLPFGTFLAMGAILYVLYSKTIYSLLLI
ncbi:MAG: prepilin signal peptidase PulO-like enzyme (type II secretory pathway) [Alteromonas naphthalenivorans]